MYPLQARTAPANLFDSAVDGVVDKDKGVDAELGLIIRVCLQKIVDESRLIKQAAGWRLAYFLHESPKAGDELPPYGPYCDQSSKPGKAQG